MANERVWSVVGALFLQVLTACNPASNESNYNRAQAETQIRENARAWANVAVTGDPSVMETILADDFAGTNPGGKLYTKQDFINDTKANPLGFASNELNDVKVRFFENVAVAQGNETFTRKDGVTGRFVWTDVLVRRDGKWVAVAAQDVIVPAIGEPSGEGLFDTKSMPETQASPEVVKQAKAAIDVTRNAYMQAWKGSDANKIATLYTEDALVLYPNRPAVSGRRAILAYFQAFFKEFGQEQFELTSVEIVISGEWAFDSGTFRWKGKPSSGGDPVEDNGKYLVVLRRQPDGAWKVHRDMDNSDRAVTSAG